MHRLRPTLRASSMTNQVGLPSASYVNHVTNSFSPCWAMDRPHPVCEPAGKPHHIPWALRIAGGGAEKSGVLGVGVGVGIGVMPSVHAPNGTQVKIVDSPLKFVGLIGFANKGLERCNE